MSKAYISFHAVAALILLFTSGYMLYDNFYKGQHAFISHDLLQYKPDVNQSPAVSFQMIREINPDTVAWLTVYGTNIDYPVVQGKDDLEYAIKDIYGKQSLTGSIYLSSSNSSDLGDWYNLIYGHHMDNGAMFGDIDKYVDREFFMTHRDGLLTTPEGNFDLNFFACLRTDAYDSIVYYIGNHEADSTAVLARYVLENSENYVEINPNSITRIIALSTCSDAAKNGRLVLFANATPRMVAVTDADDSATPVISRQIAKDHDTAVRGWSLLNFICVIATILTLIPVIFLKKKYGQFYYAKRKIRDISGILACFKGIERALSGGHKTDDLNLLGLTEGFISMHTEVSDGLKSFCRKARIGILLEIFTAVAASIVFVLTENIYLPMTLSDDYTIIMVAIFAVSLLIDFIFLRYRGKRPEQIPYFIPQDDPYQRVPT